MPSRVTWFTLAVLCAVGCGATPGPDHRAEASATRGAEEGRAIEASRGTEELARDPAWQSIPADERVTATEADAGVTATEADVTPTEASDAGVVTPPCVGACSAEADTCTDARGWRCRCEWQRDLICGGAYRPPEPSTLAWSCAPADPDADRGDGCPFREPTDRRACRAAPELTCHYAEGCGWSGVDATCVRGRWVVRPFSRPPPP